MRFPRLALAAVALTASLSAALPAAAQAQAVDLTSRIFVLREVPQADGTVKEVRDAPDRVLPGDPVLIELDYTNGGSAPANDFVAVNPIPAGLAFVSTSSPADYSVDGGQSWGPLVSLTVPVAGAAPRAAAPADVTHLRFKAPGAVAAGASGQFVFRAAVR